MGRPRTTFGDIQWPGRLPEVMPLLLGGDQLLNGGPRTANAATERAMRQICPNVNSSLLDNFFKGSEAVEQYAYSVEENFTGKLSMVKTDNGWQEDR
ncbi:lipoprotein, putative [Burkholderia orbicola MC0-3]|uniref:Lipoprotein, putative n=2 Tax=Burkholderia TaxID=32008 RepID=B1K9J4_BURO0|nr:lipoprotein, putative [Burkholderia orbicola MC0-3]